MRLNSKTCHLLLLEDCPIEAERISQAFAKLWPDLVSQLVPREPEDGTIRFKFGISEIFIDKMPAPLTWNQVKDVHSLKAYPQDMPPIRAHTCQVVLRIESDFDPLPVAQVLTQIAIATMDSCPQAVGILWDESNVILPRRIALECGADIVRKPPVPLWVSIVSEEDAKGCARAYTKGLEPLGLMEMETQRTSLDGTKLTAVLTSYASQTIRTNRQTMEYSFENITVSASPGPSSFGNPGQVLRLTFSGGSKKKGLLGIFSR